MRKILFVLMVLVTSAAFGQGVRLKTNIAGFGGAHFAGVPPGYTKLNVRYEFVAMAIDSGLHIPQYNGTPSGVRTGVWVADGAIGMDTMNHRFYIYSGGAWVRVANYAEITTPTWQQTLTAGSTLTGNNTIAGGGYNFTWDNSGTQKYNLGANKYFNITGKSGANYMDFSLGYDNPLIDMFITDSPATSYYVQQQFSAGATLSRAFMYVGKEGYGDNGYVVNQDSLKLFVTNGSVTNNIVLKRDTTFFRPPGGILTIDSLSAGASTDSVMVWNASNGKVGYRNASGLSAGSVPISGLTAATVANDINNAAYQQTWRWNSLSTGTGLRLYATSTVMDGSSVVEIASEGANASASKLAYGLQVGVSNTGTSSTNVGLNISAADATNNTSLIATSANGTTNIGIQARASGGTTNIALDLGQTGASAGTMRINGATSGSITITPAAAAGTYTLTLPTNDGDASQFLQTNGSGVLSWASSGVPTVGNQGEILQVSNGAAAWKYDTTTLVTFTAGANFAADTAAFTDSTIYGSFKLMGNDTFYVTGVSVVLYSNNAITDTLGIQITYNDTINVIGSHVFASTYAVNNETTGQDADGDDFTGSNSVPIPPGNWVWLKSPTVVAGRKPYHLSVSIIGYKKRVN